jgi:hypothetical protein
VDGPLGSAIALRETQERASTSGAVALGGALALNQGYSRSPTASRALANWSVATMRTIRP